MQVSIIVPPAAAAAAIPSLLCLCPLISSRPFVRSFGRIRFLSLSPSLECRYPETTSRPPATQAVGQSPSPCYSGLASYFSHFLCSGAGRLSGLSSLSLSLSLHSIPGVASGSPSVSDVVNLYRLLACAVCTLCPVCWPLPLLCFVPGELIVPSRHRRRKSPLLRKRRKPKSATINSRNRRIGASLTR